MAHTIIIEKGDELLQNVEKITPDTRVNHCSDAKYPTDDLHNLKFRTFTDEDGTTFVSPQAARTPADGSGSGSGS